MITMADLDAIADRDPDGGERQPSASDYARHEEWAVATYGRATWTRYKDGAGWGHNPADEPEHIEGNDNV